MNHRAVWAIYKFEMARTGRTIFQSIVSPVISTALYFVVFGAAIGSRIPEIENVNYGAFIVPGLVMMMLLTQSVMNASFGIYFPRFVGTIFEILSAPVSAFEIVLGYVGAAATKSIILGLITLATAAFFVPLSACREMRPGSAFLRQLNAAPWTYPTLVTWCPYDLMVFPGSSGRWDKANVLLRTDVPMHLWPVFSVEIHRSITAFLSSKDGTPASPRK